MAFRTISRSDNRALAVPCCKRGVRERERKTELEDERGGRWRSSPSLSCTRFEQISYKPFKKEFTYLARYQSRERDLSYTIVSVFNCKEISDTGLSKASRN